MQDIFEIKVLDDYRRYIEMYTPDIYAKLLEELAEMPPSPLDIEKHLAIGKTFITAFEQAGKTVISTEERNGILTLKKYMSKQTNLKVDGKYKLIGSRCFSHCPCLETIVFEEGVEWLEDGVVCHSDTVRSVTLPESLISVGCFSFYDCKNLSEVTFLNPKTEISWMAFDGTPWLDSFKDDFVIVNGQLLRYNGSDEEVVIPEGVTCISGRAFAENENIKSVIFSSEIEIIYNSAFENCSSLTRVVLNDKLEVIGISAFYACDSLKEVTLPESIKSIGCEAFDRDVKIIYNGNNPDILKRKELKRTVK